MLTDGNIDYLSGSIHGLSDHFYRVLRLVLHAEHGWRRAVRVELGIGGRFAAPAWNPLLFLRGAHRPRNQPLMPTRKPISTTPTIHSTPPPIPATNEATLTPISESQAAQARATTDRSRRRSRARAV